MVMRAVLPVLVRVGVACRMVTAAGSRVRFSVIVTIVILLVPKKTKKITTIKKKGINHYQNNALDK